LRWCKKSSKEKRDIHLSVAFTQEEIAEMIGTSRETVSRLLKDFRNKKLISVRGSDFIVHDRQKLELLIDLR
jgi:CRP/FNR family transcriptional regulator, cyclic AMP receptor protein